MFYLVEIYKINTYEESFVPDSPYVFHTTVANSDIADYWTTTFGADGTYNEVLKVINSVIINTTNTLLVQDSYDDMISQEDSFYFDYDTQELYVHVNEDVNIQSALVEIGTLNGYCNDTVRYFNKQEYLPIVTSIPTISESADPLQYSMIAFSSGSIQMSNPIIDGAFLFNASDKIYGSTVEIKRGTDGDNYTDLTTIFSGYVSNTVTTTTSQTVEISDNREKLEIDYPTEVFDLGQDNNLLDDTNNELIPDGYGDVIQVKAYPYQVNTGSVAFRWATVATSITTVYSYTDDEGLVEVVHGNDSNAPLSTGYFYIGDSEAYVDGDTDNSLKDIYVTGRMRDYSNPADIIQSLNEVVLGVEYNDTNYDQTEWTTEKASLSDVALYMNKSKSLYEWIEDLQSGSNYGFRYEDTEKRTIRLDRKDRDTITFDDGTTSIEPIDIRDSSISIDQNADLYASSVIVKYSYNNRLETYSQVTNDDYYDEVLQEFRIELIDTYESLLTNSTDATEKALRIASDEQTIRPLVELTVESSKYQKPRIYDIINATASLLVQGAYQSNYTNLIGDDDVLGDDYALGELFGLTYNEAKSKGLIEYYGTFVGQVLDIEPNTDNDTVTITLRDITSLRS